MTMRPAHVPTLGDNGATVFHVSYMYAIRMGWDGPIKIGRSYSAGVRLKELQIGNPCELHLLGTTQETAKLNEVTEHRRLRDRRLRGEWFDITAEDLPWVTHSVRVVDLVDERDPCPECKGTGIAVDALTLGQAARRVGVSVSRMRQLIDAGEIVAGRIGPAMMIESSELDYFMRGA